jgi:hypothetical protein
LGTRRLAWAVAPALGLPLIAKDTIKEALLAVLPGRVVEVFCRCDPEVAAQRYALRANSRPARHFDAERAARVCPAQCFGRRRAGPGTIAGWT